MQNFHHHHVHSFYSLMDGLNSPKELLQAAKDLGQNAMSVTDHGTLAAHREFQRDAKELGIKPILGLEAYISPTDRFDRRSIKTREDNTSVYHHLVIIAQNQTGLKNLQSLSEEAWKTGYYFKPRIDKDILAEKREGLVILSGCMSGLVSKALERGDDEEAHKWMRWFKETFEDNFYVEVQAHNPVELNNGLLEMADMYNVQPVATADCHYAKPEDRWLEEAMLILSTGQKVSKETTYAQAKAAGDIFERFNTLYPERPISFQDIDVFVSSRDSIREQFEKQGITRSDIYENTLAISDSVGEYTYNEHLDLLPQPKGNPEKILRDRAHKGLKARGLYTDEYIKRLDMEIDTVVRLNFPTYFLVVSDVVSEAKGRNVLVGPGRGSAAGSLLAFALGITEVDPIKYNLLFARFINDEREGYPDIDVDFPDRERKASKDYIAKKFKNVASISTYTYFTEKSVVRDSARVFGVPLADVNKALKSVVSFDGFLTSPNTVEFRGKYPEVVDLAKRLQGKVRNVGMHASGVVVSKVPLSDIAPIETRKDPKSKLDERIDTIAMDMDEAADLGLIKLDILGLKSLSVVSDALDFIRERHGKDIDPIQLGLDDPKVYAMLSAGFTKAVFQAEATPSTKLIMQMNVSNFEELAVSNALVRPGAMETVGEMYLARKEGREQTKYTHPILEPVTSETYGLIIYQEQVMQACVYLAGMSWLEADKVRSIIGKKKDVHEFDAYRDRFLEGATKNISQTKAEKLWSDFEAHAGYSFNKCASGATTVRRASSGRYLSDPDITIEKLYNVWNSNTSTGKKYRSRGIKIMAMDSDGRVRPQRVKAVYQNGEKETFRVTLSNGSYIDCTSDHRHLTPEGYLPVSELSVGSILYYSDFKYEPTEYVKTVGSGWAGETNLRLVAADGRNRPSLGGHNALYRKNIKLLSDGCGECGRTTGRLEVAHLNSDNKDNRLENLKRLCNPCHKRLDYSFGSRKPRHSKGYALTPLGVVSIASNGIEMTYDVEMDTEEHNWLGNGIVTHNSHAIAYSMITYWMAWLKYYYPLEFMTAVLKNETDDDMLTGYYTECKRLGIRILLPHVNESGINYQIEGDAIRIGLGNIKYLSEKTAPKVLSKAPFATYADLLALMEEKGSGVSTRIVSALNAVGAAALPGNPRRGDEKNNYYEYLKIPMFDLSLIPPAMLTRFDKCEDYEESGVYAVLGMVKSVVRKPGWARVEMVDDTASIGIFHNENTAVEPGNMYVFLIADNRIQRYIHVDELKDLKSDVLVQFLIEAPEPVDGKYYVVDFNSRKSKAGSAFASIILARGEEMKKVMVFNSLYRSALGRMVPGTMVDLVLAKTKDDSLYVKEIK